MTKKSLKLEYHGNGIGVWMTRDQSEKKMNKSKVKFWPMSATLAAGFLFPQQRLAEAASCISSSATRRLGSCDSSIQVIIFRYTDTVFRRTRKSSPINNIAYRDDKQFCCRSIYSFVCLNVFLSVRLFVCLSVCPFIYLPVCSPTCMSAACRSSYDTTSYVLN